MSTTIDSLSIEIRSNSTNAAQGIRDLAKSLSELKQSGTVSVAIKNLNNLSTALKGFADASNATRSVGRLVGAMSRLKEVGKIPNIGGTITKLSESLKTLDNINIDSVGPQIKKLTEAVAPLSTIKSGGLGTMVNALSKLDKVTESLSDDNIAAFADKVKKLNAALEPLSTKMTTIQSGLRGISSASRSAGSSVRSMGENVNSASINFSSFIYSLQTVIGWLQQAIQKFSQFMEQAIEWDGIAARFGRTFGSQAQEVYDWIVRLNKEMGINIQQFMQYSSLYAQMLLGFGVAAEDARIMALGYAELTYDVWAGANDRYKTFEEAADAVASAIAGEVEPVRRAGFTIVESTLEQTAANIQLKDSINGVTEANSELVEITEAGADAFKNLGNVYISDETLARTAANYGLTFSIEKATEAEKTYLRYLTLVNQAQSTGIIGTYAKELNTAEGLTRTLSQQIKSLTQAFGSLFLPILVRVVPWLQAVVSLLTDAVMWLASLFGVKIQAVDWSSYNDGSDAIGGVADSANDATSALGGAAKAAKELKNATLGIDELNVISPPDPSSGGGGGSGGNPDIFDGLDLESLWDESIFENVQTKVGEIKEKIKNLLPVVGGVATALAGWNILKFLDNLDDADIKIGRLKPTLEGIGKTLAVAGISIVVGKLVWDFTGAYLEGGGTTELLKALGTTALGAALAYWLAGPAGAAFVILVSGVVSLTRLIVEISEGTVEWDSPEALTTMLVGGLETILGGVFTWKLLSPIIGPAIKGLIPSIGSALGGAFAAIGPALAAAAPYIAIGAAIVSVITLALVDYDFTEIGHTIGEKIGSALRSTGKWIGDTAKAIGEGVSDAIAWAKDFFDVETIGELIAVIFDLDTWIELIIPKISEMLSDAWEWVLLKDKNLKENINEFFRGFFEGLFEGLEIEGFDTSKIDFAEIFGDAGGVLISPVTLPIKLAKYGWKSVKEWVGTLPTLSQSIGLVKQNWKDVKSWIGDLPVIQQGISLVKKSWSTVKSWIGNIPTLSQTISLTKSGWTTVKGWIGTLPTLSQAISLVKSGWTTVKGWIGEMPSLSAKIKLLKDGWSTVKDWLGGLTFDLKFKLPKIKVDWGTKEYFGFTITYPKGFTTYAKGGFPDMGEFFVAREAGPEMVGKIGGRSAVVNNDQIVESVSEGVYAAVMAAMKSANSEGGQAVNVYLDGKLIARNVEKHQKERGATIMGTQVYSY